MRLPLLVALAAAILLAQGPPPRRTRPDSATTAAQPELKPEDYALVSGVVTSTADGSPLRKATVTLRRSDNSRRESPQTAATGDGGVFLFAKVAPGRYKLHLERNGYVGQDYGARRPSATGQEVRVEKGQRLIGLQAKMQPHGVVTGFVRDEDGEPMAGVRVQVFRWGHVQGRRQLLPQDSDNTDDRGQYRIYGVPPGKYVVSATSQRGYRGESGVAPAPPEASGEETYLPVYYPGSLEAAQATAMEIAAGASLEGIDFTLRKVRTVRVSGRVVRPVAAAEERGRPTMVMLLPRGNGVIGSMNAPRAMTDAKGVFTVRGVSPGSYTLHAEDSERQTRLTADAAIDVGAAGLESVVLTLSPGVDVSGSIVVEEAAASQTTEKRRQIGIFIRSRQGGGGGPFSGGQNTVAKDDGTFTAEAISPGEYDVSVSGLPEGYYLKSIRAADQESLHTGFTVAASSAPALRITASPNAGNLEGSVVDKDQKPIAGSTVVLWPVAKNARPALFKSATTDAQGHYTVTSIAPGEYRLAAFEFLETGAAQDPDYLQTFESKAEKLTIQEKSRETKTLIEMVEP